MDIATEIRQWAMTTPEERWRSRAAALAAELGSDAVPLALDLVDGSMEPASVGFGVRILGEVDPAYPERAYWAAGELASMVFGLSGEASLSPQWTFALRQLLVAVSRLPVWAGFDHLLGHSASWLDGVHVGGVLMGSGRRTVAELGGLARLDESEPVQAFVALVLSEMAVDEASAALEDLAARTRWPSVRAAADGRPIEVGDRSAEVSGWLEARGEAQALAPEIQPNDLEALLRDESRAFAACEILAHWGEAGSETHAEASALLLESLIQSASSPALRATAARARVRTEHGSLAERVWFLRYDEREHVRATLVHACEGDERRLRDMLDDPSGHVASWAVMRLGALESPADATVSRVLSLALERAGSEAAAQAIEVFADSWQERVPDADFVRAARANVTDGRWSSQVIGALSSRPAPELAEAVRSWRPVDAYEEELRAEALGACEA